MRGTEREHGLLDREKGESRDEMDEGRGEEVMMKWGREMDRKKRKVD